MSSKSYSKYHKYERLVQKFRRMKLVAPWQKALIILDNWVGDFYFLEHISRDPKDRDFFAEALEKCVRDITKTHLNFRKKRLALTLEILEIRICDKVCAVTGASVIKKGILQLVQDRQLSLLIAYINELSAKVCTEVRRILTSECLS